MYKTMVYETAEKCKTDSDIKESIKNEQYNIWDEKRIKEAFQFGHGTYTDFERYMKDNNNNSSFIDAYTMKRIY